MEKWEELIGGALLPAEKQAIDACRAGEFCTLGDGSRPEGPDDTRKIRAVVLRKLILGGFDVAPTHELGVTIAGAYVTGALNLSLMHPKGSFTKLNNCCFEKGIHSYRAKFEMLDLDGSKVPFLHAMECEVSTHLLLGEKFHAKGEVNLRAATIGGQLEADGGKFENPTGLAISANGIRVGGSVVMSKHFKADGKVDLSAATIGGQLNAKGGYFRFFCEDKQEPEQFALFAQGIDVRHDVFLSEGFKAEGGVNFAGATIGAQFSLEKSEFDNPNALALHAPHLTIKQALNFQDVNILNGVVNFAAAQVGTLVDDLASWPEDGRVILDGFTYDRISGGAPTDSKTRLDWLSRGDGWREGFFPQPYQQCAKVLRIMGLEAEAKNILIERQKRIHQHHRQNFKKTNPKRAALWIVDGLYHALLDYGYQPLKALGWLLALWFVTVYLAAWAWNAGDMVPNSDVILTSENWAAIHDAEHPANAWEGSPEGQAWESFSRYAWAADVVIPILDLGQTEAWSPSRNHGRAGHVLWVAKPLISSAGWIILAFAAAGVTGVARRQD